VGVVEEGGLGERWWEAMLEIQICWAEMQ